MPYQIKYSGTGAHILFTGIVEFADAVHCREEIWRGAGADSLAYCIIDFTESALLDISPDQVRAFSRADQQRVARIAIVAPADHIYGTCRIWLGRSDSIARRSEVFRQLGEAHAWLRELGVELPAAALGTMEE